MLFLTSHQYLIHAVVNDEILSCLRWLEDALIDVSLAEKKGKADFNKKLGEQDFFMFLVLSTENLKILYYGKRETKKAQIELDKILTLYIAPIHKTLGTPWKIEYVEIKNEEAMVNDT